MAQLAADISTPHQVGLLGTIYIRIGAVGRLMYLCSKTVQDAGGRSESCCLTAAYSSSPPADCDPDGSQIMYDMVVV